jgi:hypothetical protein
MNISSNSKYRLLKEEDDYSFVTEYITESEDQTIEIINSKYKNIISKLIIDGEEKENLAQVINLNQKEFIEFILLLI